MDVIINTLSKMSNDDIILHFIVFGYNCAEFDAGKCRDGTGDHHNSYRISIQKSQSRIRDVG